MEYALLKMVHQTTVALSIAGFVARGAAMLVGAAWVATRTARVLPHVVDTVLLGSGVALAWTLHLAPGANPWLTAKIVALLVYIALGMLALRPGRPPALRVLAGLCAMATFGYIVGVAVTRNPGWPAAGLALRVG